MGSGKGRGVNMMAKPTEGTASERIAEIEKLLAAITSAAEKFATTGAKEGLYSEAHADAIDDFVVARDTFFQAAPQIVRELLAVAKAAVALNEESDFEYCGWCSLHYGQHLEDCPLVVFKDAIAKFESAPSEGEGK